VSPPKDPLITVHDAVLHQQLGEETVLLHLGTERYYGLDEVGSRVWLLLREHRTLDPIVMALVDEYEVDEETLRRDLERLLDELADLGLIHLERA
jgi:hypothetical protein